MCKSKNKKLARKMASIRGETKTSIRKSNDGFRPVIGAKNSWDYFKESSKRYLSWGDDDKVVQIRTDGIYNPETNKHILFSGSTRTALFFQEMVDLVFKGQATEQPEETKQRLQDIDDTCRIIESYEWYDGQRHLDYVNIEEMQPQDKVFFAWLGLLGDRFSSDGVSVFGTDKDKLESIWGGIADFLASKVPCKKRH